MGHALHAGTLAWMINRPVRLQVKKHYSFDNFEPPRPGRKKQAHF